MENTLTQRIARYAAAFPDSLADVSAQVLDTMRKTIEAGRP